MTEIYKIEDEFSICDKNCNYLNTCLDTYVDYYKNINPYDTQLILAKSNIGNEIDDMEEMDYLNYFDQNFDKVDNIYTDLILKPRGMKKKLRFDDKVMDPEVIDAEDLTPDFDKINYNETPIMNDDSKDEVKMIEQPVEDKPPVENKELEIQNINQGEGDIATVVKTEDNRKINETNNNVNETVNNVNETVNNVNEAVDNTSKPVTTNIDARTTNIYNQEQNNKEINEPIVEKSSIPEIKEASEQNIAFEKETEKEPQRENELINNPEIKSDLSDFSLRQNEGILKDKNISEEKKFEEQKNILPLENDEKRNREKTENTQNIPENKELNKELNKPFQQQEFEKPEGKFEYNPQRSSVIEQKPERPMEQRPMEQKKEEKEDKPNISISLEDDSGSGMNPMMYPPGYPSSGNSRMLEKLNEQTQEIAKLKGDLEKERSDHLGKDNMDRINEVIKEKDELIKKREEEITDLTQKIESIPENIPPTSNDSNLGNELIEKNNIIEQLETELKKVQTMQNNMMTRQQCDGEKDEQMKFLKGIYDHLMSIEGKCDDTTLESIKNDQAKINDLITDIQTSIPQKK